MNILKLQQHFGGSWVELKIFLIILFFFFSCETCFYYVVEVLHEKKHTLREFVLILFNKSRFTFDLLTKDILAFSLQKGDENQKFQVSF